MTIIRLKDYRKSRIANKLLFGVANPDLVSDSDLDRPLKLNLVGGSAVRSKSNVDVNQNVAQLLRTCMLKGRENNA